MSRSRSPASFIDSAVDLVPLGNTGGQDVADLVVARRAVNLIVGELRGLWHP
jgi:hypothetical protein